MREVAQAYFNRDLGAWVVAIYDASRGGGPLSYHTVANEGAAKREAKKFNEKQATLAAKRARASGS